MSYANFPPLSIELKPSRAMQCVLAVSHSSALLGVFCSDLPMLVQWLAVLVICSSGRHYYVRYGLRSGRCFVHRVQRLADNRWRLITLSGGKTFILSAYYVHPALLILNFAASSGNMLGRSQTLVIAADAADTASLRQLRWQLQYADREQDACE